MSSLAHDHQPARARDLTGVSRATDKLPLHSNPVNASQARETGTIEDEVVRANANPKIVKRFEALRAVPSYWGRGGQLNRVWLLLDDTKSQSGEAVAT